MLPYPYYDFHIGRNTTDRHQIATLEMRTTKATAATTTTTIGEHRPEKGISLRPAPTAAELRAALAAANIAIPQRPEKAVRPASGGRRGRARITLSEPLQNAFADLGWEAPTRTSILVVPPTSQIPPSAMAEPVPQVPAAWSQSAASLLLLAHGANGLLPILSEGQTVTLSHFLIVAHDLRTRGGFPANKGGRKGNVGYLSAPELFFRALGAATRRMVSADYQADTIRLVSSRD